MVSEEIRYMHIEGKCTFHRLQISSISKRVRATVSRRLSRKDGLSPNALGGITANVTDIRPEPLHHLLVDLVTMCHVNQ